MSVSEQMPLADVQNRLSEVVDMLEREHGQVVITKHGIRLPSDCHIASYAGQIAGCGCSTRRGLCSSASAELPV
jgi:hypothetical protein